jgi:hypothetical protein
LFNFLSIYCHFYPINSKIANAANKTAISEVINLSSVNLNKTRIASIKLAIAKKYPKIKLTNIFLYLEYLLKFCYSSKFSFEAVSPDSISR